MNGDTHSMGGEGSGTNKLIAQPSFSKIPLPTSVRRNEGMISSNINTTLFSILPEIYDKDMEAFKKIHERVKLIINKHPQVTGDYRLLDAYYLSNFNRVSYCRYENGSWKPLTIPEIRQLPSFESINRSFRKHQEEGSKPTKRVQEKRRLRQLKLHRFFSKKYGGD